MKEKIILVRGAGDIATGVIQKLHRCGFKVVATEIEKPMAVRRTVSLSEAIYEGNYKVEDVEAILVSDIEEINIAWNLKKVPIFIDPNLEILNFLKPDVIVDAIIAKKNLGINKNLCKNTIALGPGFIAGEDVDIVIETNRGHDLARLIFEGSASPNTGIPGETCGFSTERVLYAPCDGVIENYFDICDFVKKNEVISEVNGIEVKAEIEGVLRGLIRNKSKVKKGMKIGDIEPRTEINCYTISDKARAIGGSVLEAVIILLN